MVTEQHFRKKQHEIQIFENFKNFDFSTVDSGKTVAVIRETTPKVSSRVQNLQEKAFS